MYYSNQPSNSLFTVLHQRIISSLIMDSCNSGSIQSSSCGDDEYDSRAPESNNISAAFLNNPSRNHVDVGVGVGPFTTTNNHNHHLNPHPSPPSSQQHNHTHIFDPSLSNYLESIQKSSPNPFLNLDNMLWSKPLTTPRSEPDLAAALMLPSSSSQQQNHQAFLLSQLAGQSQTRGVNVSAVPPESSSRPNDQAVSNNSGTTTTNNNTVRNPKKRSRASRRAPTTVLTTDTTNFRAMVQEFTGIPAPPFTSSPFPRTRLDLFGSSTTRSTFDPSPPPSYLLRPFAQKLQPPSHPFQPSSSMVENLASNNHNPPTHNSPYNLSSSTSHSQGDHLGIFNMHNSILGFQSISQQIPKYQPGNSSKTQPSLEISPGVDSHLKMNVLEELGLSHSHPHVNTNTGGSHHQNMVSGTSSDREALMSRLNNNNNNNNNMRSSLDGEWAQRPVSTIADNDRGILGSTVNYRSDNIIQERVSNAKVVNYTASPSGPECAVVARGEGTVESWINCSSSD